MNTALIQLFAVLREHQYKEIQYIPSRRSVFGIFKEWDNINNLRTKAKHQLFYFSFFPSVYLRRITKNRPGLRDLYTFCFLNQPLSAQKVVQLFGQEWITIAVEQNVVRAVNNGYALLYSVLPIKDYLILRDSHNAYKYHELESDKPKDRVWVGADSVKFAQLNQKYLAGQKFKSTLELGCGTGIQLVCFENLSQNLTGIDINPRAVEFTKISASLNNLEERFTVLLSDLFEKLENKYDVILANPWFIDIDQGGLEEIPDIVDKLDNYLENNGLFVMYFSSYVKDSVDLGKELLSKFAKEKGYSATLYGLGKTVETEYLEKYKKHNISHINNYYALLVKNGGNSLTVVPPSVLRRTRDVFFIALQKLIKKSAYNS